MMREMHEIFSARRRAALRWSMLKFPAMFEKAATQRCAFILILWHLAMPRYEKFLVAHAG